MLTLPRPRACGQWHLAIFEPPSTAEHLLFTCNRVKDVVHFDLLNLMHKQGKPAEDYSMEPLSEEAPFSQKMLSKVYTIVPMLWRCDCPEGRPVKPPVRLTSWPALSEIKALTCSGGTPLESPSDFPFAAGVPHDVLIARETGSCILLWQPDLEAGAGVDYSRGAHAHAPF